MAGTILHHTLPAPKPKEPVRFIGTHVLKVAPSTNQVTLPRSIKKAIENGDEGEHLVMIPRDDVSFLQLMTQKVFYTLLDATKNNPKFPEEKNMRAKQKLSSAASTVEPDTQSRFVLPKKFIEKMGESNEVVLESAHTYLKLWTRQDYDTEQKRIKESDIQDVLADILNI